MVTYLVYAPISFFFDSVATISLKSLSTLLRKENNSNLGLYYLYYPEGLSFVMHHISRLLTRNRESTLSRELCLK